MKNLSYYYRYLVLQTGPNDCGPACLEMIMNYAGVISAARTGLPDLWYGGEVSLLDLRDIARNNGLDCRCVEMELSYLRQLSSPCILHTSGSNGGHFIVLFAAGFHTGEEYFQTADPASGLKVIDRAELEGIWRSGAALYFEGLRERRSASAHPLLSLFRIPPFRVVLLLCIAMLSVSSATLGVAVSWLLQRGIDQPLSEKPLTVVTALIVMLALITLFRSLMNFIKQQVLVRSDSAVTDFLYNKVIRIAADRMMPVESGAALRGRMSEIQQIRNAVAAFLAVIASDGTILAAILTGLWAWDTISGLLISVYTVLIAFLSARTAAGFAAQKLELKRLAASLELELAATSQMRPDREYPVHKENLAALRKSMEGTALHLNLTNLWYDLSGGAVLITVIVYGLHECRGLDMAYPTFMLLVIMTYYAVTLIPRICNAFAFIAEASPLVGKLTR